MNLSRWIFSILVFYFGCSDVHAEDRDRALRYADLINNLRAQKNQYIDIASKKFAILGHYRYQYDQIAFDLELLENGLTLQKSFASKQEELIFTKNKIDFGIRQIEILKRVLPHRYKSLLEIIRGYPDLMAKHEIESEELVQGLNALQLELTSRLTQTERLIEEWRQVTSAKMHRMIDQEYAAAADYNRFRSDILSVISTVVTMRSNFTNAVTQDDYQRAGQNYKQFVLLKNSAPLLFGAQLFDDKRQADFKRLERVLTDADKFYTKSFGLLIDAKLIEADHGDEKRNFASDIAEWFCGLFRDDIPRPHSNRSDDSDLRERRSCKEEIVDRLGDLQGHELTKIPLEISLRSDNATGSLTYQTEMNQGEVNGRIYAEAFPNARMSIEPNKPEVIINRSSVRDTYATYEAAIKLPPEHVHQKPTPQEIESDLDDQIAARDNGHRRMRDYSNGLERDVNQTRKDPKTPAPEKEDLKPLAADVADLKEIVEEYNKLIDAELASIDKNRKKVNRIKQGGAALAPQLPTNPHPSDGVGGDGNANGQAKQELYTLGNNFSSKLLAMGLKAIESGQNKLALACLNTSIEISKALGQMAVDLSIAGVAADLQRALMGKDPFTGSPLTLFDQTIASVSFFAGVTTGGMGSAITHAAARATATAAQSIAGASRNLPEALSAAEKLLESAAKLGFKTKPTIDRYAQFSKQIFKADTDGVKMLDRIVETAEKIKPQAGNKFVQELPSEFKYTKSFEGAIHKGTYEPGELVFQAQRTGQSGPGNWFSPIKPISAEHAEELLYINKYGNDAGQIKAYIIKERVSGYAGKVADGAGYQFYIPEGSPLSELLEEVRL